MQSASTHVKGLLSYGYAVFDVAPLFSTSPNILDALEKVFTGCCLFDVSFSAKGTATATPKKTVLPQRFNMNQWSHAEAWSHLIEYQLTGF